MFDRWVRTGMAEAEEEGAAEEPAAVYDVRPAAPGSERVEPARARGKYDPRVIDPLTSDWGTSPAAQESLRRLMGMTGDANQLALARLRGEAL
jgi:hypothetical protein